MIAQKFNIFLIIMSIVALIVFVALFYINAGYGKFRNNKWGFSINNKLGWILMESPVFIVMTLLWLYSNRMCQPVLLIMFLLFQIHYFQRTFIFPFLIKGAGKMPFSIILMGMIFNTLNAIMQGGWLFYISDVSVYSLKWLYSPQFIAGTLLFIAGMFINIDSDRRIRGLRTVGDNKHYLPSGGMYNYVTSANYFGEIIEWTGFAILTWSWAGAVFAWWTFANLVPRANTIYKRYKIEFSEQMKGRHLKRVIPFIY